MHTREPYPPWSSGRLPEMSPEISTKKYQFLSKFRNLPNQKSEFSYIFYSFLTNLPEIKGKSPWCPFETYHMYGNWAKFWPQKEQCISKSCGIHKNVISIWVPSSEFVSSSIPSWQILTAHAQPFRGARDLAFCLKVPLDSLLVWASSEGSGETARMRRLAWTFAARICYKYQIHLTRSISWVTLDKNLWSTGKTVRVIFWGKEI